jgi:hypothetical protein
MESSAITAVFYTGAIGAETPLEATRFHRMTEHISRMKIDQFRARALDAQELIAIWEHIDSCEACRRLYQEVSQSRRQGAPSPFSLSLEHLLRNDHFDYETMAGYVDETLDSEMREIADIHLRVCVRCRKDLKSLVDFRRQIEPELKVRYGPGARSGAAELIGSWWRGLRVAWEPAYTAATLSVIGVAVAAAIYFINVGSGKKPTRGNSHGHTPSPSVVASVSPAPKDSAKGTAQFPETTPTPNPDFAPGQFRPPRRQPRADLAGKKNAPPAETIALNDDGRNVALNSSGRLTGLDNLAPELQQSIKEFLLAAEVKRPDILSEIGGVNSALRGTGTGQKQSFKLLSPVGVVIAEDRPVFKWEPLEGATAYRVEISDSPSRAPVSSEQLSPHVTQWTPPEALRRGKIYSWVVIATVKGREVVSPSVSMPEAKFKVLEEMKARELNRLKRANSHLSLGVFYALEGMATEADREFQILVDNNPQSSIAQRLLRIIESWK